MIVRVYDE